MDLYANSQENYPIAKKLLLRFTFLYTVLYIIPHGFEYLYGYDLERSSIWTPLTTWFGETFFGWEFNLDRLYMGLDSHYDFARFGLITCMSIIGTVIWILLDKQYTVISDVKLNTLFRAILRYHVGFTLIVYGLAKVYPLQFGSMGIDRLIGETGNQSPMGFLWTFMSYSRFYTGATGWVEVIGGLFLLFRKTTFLGAVVCVIAMINVVLIDIGYNVTVKMFASHLLLMSFILLLADLNRILNFLIFNRAVNPNNYLPLFDTGYPKIISLITKSAILIYFTVTTIQFMQERITNEMKVVHPSFKGLYEIDEFIINHDTIPPLLTDESRWKTISVGGNSYVPDYLSVNFMDDQKKFYQFELDTIAQVLKFKDLRIESDQYEFSYRYKGDKKMVFEGTHLGDSIIFTTTVKRSKDFRLTGSEIEWLRNW